MQKEINIRLYHHTDLHGDNSYECLWNGHQGFGSDPYEAMLNAERSKDLYTRRHLKEWNNEE